MTNVVPLLLALVATALEELLASALGQIPLSSIISPLSLLDAGPLLALNFFLIVWAFKKSTSKSGSTRKSR